MLSPGAGMRGRKAETAGSRGGWHHCPPRLGPTPPLAFALGASLGADGLGASSYLQPHRPPLSETPRAYLLSVLPSGDVSQRTYCAHTVVARAGRDLHKEPLVTRVSFVSHTPWGPLKPHYGIWVSSEGQEAS